LSCNLRKKKKIISAASVFSKDQFSHPCGGVGIVILNTVNSVRLLFVTLFQMYVETFVANDDDDDDDNNNNNNIMKSLSTS
jgi:hypothetical protein